MNTPRRTPAELQNYAKWALENDMDLNNALWSVHADQRDYFKRIYRATRKPRNMAEMISPPTSPHGVLTIPQNFLSDWSEMTQGLGELMLVQIPKALWEGTKLVGEGVKQEIGSLIPGERGQPYRDANERAVRVAKAIGNQLLQEILAKKTDQMKALEATLEATDDPVLEASIAAQLQNMRTEQKPLLSAVNELFGETYGYLVPGHEASFMEMVAYEPATVMSDLAGIAAIIASRGASASGTLGAANVARFLTKVERILDFVDPATLPFAGATTGIGKMTEPGSRLMRGQEADMSDDKMRELAERFGIDDPMDMPTSQYNRHERFTTDEQFALEQPGRVGDRALGRIESSYDAGVDAAGRLQDEMNQAGASLDAQHAGARALEALDETQLETKMQARQEYKPLNEHGDKTFDPEFGLEAKLQGIIDDLRGTGEAVDPDARAAANILEKELNLMREQEAKSIKAQSGSADKVVSNDELTGINQMSLSSLRQIRTNFRKAYKSQFLSDAADRPVQIGTGSEEMKTYNRVTELLDQAIDDMVARTPEMETDTGDMIKAGDKIWRDRAQLEGTVGGQLLFKNKDNPIGLIDKIFSDKKITNDEMENIFTLLGEDGATDLRAGLLHRIFENTGLNEKAAKDATTLKQRAQPTSLSKAISRMESGRDGFVEAVFGEDVANELRDLATFMDGLQPSFDILRGSQTRKANIRLNQAKRGGISSAVGFAIGTGTEIMQMIYFTGSGGIKDGAIVAGAATVVSFLAQQGVEVWKFSETQRRRLAEGLELSPRQQQLVDRAIEYTRLKYTKPVEAASRIKYSKEKIDEEKQNKQ